MADPVPVLTMTSAGDFGLSPQQRRLWQLQRTLGERPFRARALARIRGELDLDLLRRAVDEVVGRYEILRTTFPCPEGLLLPVQRVANEAAAGWHRAQDLSGLTGGATEAALEGWLRNVEDEPFDPAQGPLLRLAVASFSGDKHALALVLPALCADAVTLGHLVRRIASSYAALAGGSPDWEDSDPLQYADLAEWQNELLQREETVAGREYWAAWDPAACRALRLPFENARPEGERFQPRTLSVPLDHGVARRALALSAAMGTSLSTLCLAAWQALIWRLLGQPEIVLGFVAECRSYEGLSESLGPLAALIPLPCQLDGSLRFTDAVASARDAVQTATEWQEYFRWESVAERWGLAMEDTVFPVSFAVLSHPAPWLAGPLRWTLQSCAAEIDRCHLELRVRVDGGPPAMDLVWNAAVFSRENAETVARAWQALLAAAVAQPEARLGQLTLASPEERHLLALAGTAGGAAAPALVHELFAQQARRVPDRAAAVCDGRSLTYAELAQQASRLSLLLRRHGVGPDVLVAVCLDRSLALPLAVLGVLEAGGAYLPLEPGLPRERKSFLLTNARPQAVLTETRFLKHLPATGVPILCLDAPWEADLATTGDAPAWPAPDPANLVYVIYTSGSTGAPKGVAVEHRQLANYINGVAERLALPDGATYAMVSTFAADLGNTMVFPALCGGGTLHLIPDERTSDPVAMAAALASNPVDCMKITPSHLEALLAGAPNPGLLPRRCLVLGGEASRREWVERVAALSPGLRVINHYGPTETTVGVLTYAAEPGLRTATLPLGRVLPGSTAWLLGPEPLPAWFPGELYLGGAGVARGYLGRPDLTAERFVPDPLAGAPGARMYRTGDLARRLPDGTFEFLGRADGQVKIRGFRIELGEVETILEAHPEVRRAAVAARDDGFGSPRLAAYLVTKNGTAVDSAELRDYLLERLPEFMIPSAFLFLDTLPLNASGKVDRRALPQPDWRHLGESVEFVAPETPTEQLLAQVWAEVLGVERVGARDNFFLLGGDSIRGIVTRARAEERGVVFSIQQIFDHPVLGDLAGAVEQGDVSVGNNERPEPFELLTGADRARLPEGVKDAYPLARLQAGMLFHSEIAPATGIYHDIHSYHVVARFDPALLRETVAKVALRHPVLRTSFELAGYSEPLQLVHAAAVPTLEQHDLRAVAADDQESVVRDWLRQERQRPFDWSRPPLVSFHVHLRSDESFQFSMSFHHSILDGWSSASLLTELFRRYLGALEGTALDEEAPPSATLREFVHLERTTLASAEAREFWRRHLEGSPLIRLPRRRGKDGEANRRAEHVELPLPLELSDGLKRVARSLSLPLKSIVMAVHFRVLGLLSGSTDVVSGVVSNGRPERADGERAIGLFLNTLPLRMALPGGSWGDLAHAAFVLERASLPFRRFPLSELQQLAGGRALFEIAFNFLHFHVYDSLAQIPEIRVISSQGYEETNFSLLINFQLTGTSSRIHLRLSYQAAEHDREEIEEVSRRYLAALEGMAGAPHAPYDTWGLFTDAERAQLLAWNRTVRPARLPRRMHEIFEVQAERTPDAAAAEMDSGRLTYRELDHRAGRLARRLRAAGIGLDDPVGMCLERSLAVPVAVLGILKAGGAYLPLDSAYPAERLAAMAEDARLRWLVCEEATLSRLPMSLREQVRLLLLGPAGEMADGDAGAPPPAQLVATENLAYVLYTSGSTGRPKGVAMPHGALANLIDWQLAATAAPGPRRTAQFSALSFDVSFQEMFTTWGQGGTLVLLSEEVRRDAGFLLRLLAERSVEQLFLPFVALQQLADEAATRGVLPTALREVITAGEQLQATAAVRELFHRLPGCRLVNAYGPTETHVVTAFTLPEPPHTWPTLPPIGQPIANVWLRVLDASGQPVLPGVPGEVYCGGAGLARGYLGRPDRTAERFLPDPQAAEPGARVYRTGDLARHLPDGGIEFLGRTDHQVKVRGFRVEPGEIEAALALHPEVREAAVVAREVSGPGDRRLVGYVVPRGRSAAEAGDAFTGELRTFLAGRLPEHMVPWTLVPLDAFPLTPSGKLDRRHLPAPGAARRRGTDVAPPRGPVEESVAAFWAEVLGSGPVGIHENFFELGGHSLLATRVVSRVRATFGIDLPLRMLFDAPTVAGLAAAVEGVLRAGTAPAPPLSPAGREVDPPLSFAQQRLWFLDQLLPGDPIYSLHSALRFAGALDPQALAKSFSAVVARHEVLRTTFAVRDGEPVQRIAPPAAVALPVTDLGGLPPERAEAEAHRLAAEAARRRFDLARGPLLRVALVRLGGQDHALLLNLHHIVADAWSMGVLVREMTALYASFVMGTPTVLPELPVQYSDYAVWQRNWLRGEALEAQLAWWRQELARPPGTLGLPLDRPRPRVSSHRGGQVALALSAELATALAALGRHQSATLFMTLLAGWSALLSRYAAQEDVLVGSAIANRTRLETENLIGFFVNTLVLRTDLSGSPRFGEVVARVRRATLGAYDHQDLPFDRLVEELAPERSLNRSPLFQVMFGLQNAPVETIEMAGLKLSPLQLTGETAKFDLSLSLTEVADRLHAGLGYNTDLFDRATAERLLGHFRSLLAEAVAAPTSRLADLTLLGTAEREQLARETEASRRGSPDVALAVPGLFAEVAQRMPTAMAVTGAGEHVTFGELRRWSSRVAGLLRREGLGLERRVAVCAEPSAALVAGVLAVWEAGGVWVPLDPAHPDERLAVILEDSGADLLLIQERLAGRFAALGARTLLLNAAATAGGDPEQAAPTPLAAAAYVIYTSGTTGRPKGTVVSHHSLAGYLTWFNRRFAEAGALPIPCISSPGFDASLKQLLAPLLRGESVWTVPPGTGSRPDDLLAEIAARRGTALNCIPSLWRALLDRIEDGWGVEGAPRHLLLGGEALDPSLAERTLAALPGIEIWNLYGPTEATANASCACVTSGRITIGRGVAGAALHIIDHRLQLVPPGMPGELAITGSGLARGYLGLPATTAERFVPNPFAIGPGERLYRTGDRTRVLPDGEIELLGRLDHQVKIRGVRLEPGEVEAALCRHPAVAQAVVAAWESASEDARLAAWVVPAAGAAPDPAELRALLRTVLPETMVPSAWTLLPALPLTPNGKVDRASLPPPDRSSAAATTYAEPQTAAEQAIAEIWRDLLGAERVGLHDNFFDLGGHSLLLVRVQSRLSRLLGREVTMVDLFSHPTVASLAQLLTGAAGADTAPARRAGQMERIADGKQRLRRLRQVPAADRRTR